MPICESRQHHYETVLSQVAHPIETQLRCLVPASDIGHVIGRKGETVQSMRDRSGATIKVHEGNSGAALSAQSAMSLSAVFP